MVRNHLIFNRPESRTESRRTRTFSVEAPRLQNQLPTEIELPINSTVQAQT